MEVSAAWERHSPSWITWTEAPGRSGFRECIWPAIESILPSGQRGIALDLGCGEGRAARELLRLGYRIIGLDRSPTLAKVAANLSERLPVIIADAAQLPIASESIQLVVACMSLHDMDNLRGALREVGRVLTSGGQLCLSIVHPFATATDNWRDREAPYRISCDYALERKYEDRVRRDGLEMTFTSVHRPLGAYAMAIAAGGLAIRELNESGKGPIPWLLVIRAEKI